MERLLKYFIPENYHISLNINKETEVVQGKVDIIGQKPGKKLKLHAKNLKFTSVKVNGKAKETNSEKDDVFEIKDVSETGKITISICYSFELSHNMEGVYLSTYQYQGKEEKLVSTQFESHYAREGFPCVDEPEAKATFDLEITDNNIDDIILANMPAKSEHVTKKPNSSRTVVFETTPRMSTYLVAFAVGRMNSVTTTNKHGVKVTTYAVLNQDVSLLDFPNQIAADALDLYDDLFGTRYPLPKMDQVAIPDFEAGAMENWGLVTYREACLLADENSPKSVQEYVATVITHELSHQWFGDLVTMRWWNNLWLNESFANMMQYYSADKLHPEWLIWNDFFTDDCYAALNRDALPGVQAVQQDVTNPAEIATLFDGAIVYAKGAHLMFMLMRLMGEQAFFSGLKDYFDKYQYSNTAETDLWNSLQPYANFDVAKFMNAWISQSGYPVISDKKQQRFLFNGQTDKTKWPLPEITDDMSGHYIINLSQSEFEQKLSNFDNLSLEQKIRLLIDRQLLSKTSLVSSASLLDILPKFKEEKSVSVFTIISDIMNSLKVFCPPDSEYYPKYQKFVLDIVSPSLKRLGYQPKPGEDDDDTKIRQIALGFALYAKDPEVIKNLSDIYDNNRGKKYTELNPEIRNACMSAKMESSGEQIWDQYLADYQVESNPTVKSQLLSNLTDVETPEYCKKVLALLKEPKIVKPQDHIYLVAYLLGNFYTREETFDWIYHNWDYIESITSDKSMDDYCRVAAARVRTDEQAKKFFEFFDKKKDDPVLSRSIEVARIDIATRLRWIKEDSKSVHDRLK